MTETVNVPCCACGSSQSATFHETTYPEHGYPGVFVLRKCDGCGLLFNSPRLDLESLSALYGSNYYFFNRPDSTELDRAATMYLRTIALVATQISEKRSLDVGCGRGYFPALLRSLGWNASGIEISSDASQYAREKFELDVFTGTIEQYVESPRAKTFPLVSAIDVIEHVPSPESFIKAIAKTVEANGTLIIDTPNGSAANIESQKLHWQGFNPFHVFLFNTLNLPRLLEQHRLRVERAFSYHNTPKRLGLREFVHGATKMLGVAKPAAKLYFDLRARRGRGGDIQAHLANAVSRARTEPNFDASPDANAELAQGARGDNIIVIARKM